MDSSKKTMRTREALGFAREVARQGWAMVSALTGDDETRAMRAAEDCVLELAKMMKALGVDLHEVLPVEACTRCARPCVDFRRVGDELVCVICADRHVDATLRHGMLVPPAPPSTKDDMSREAILDAARAAVQDRDASYGTPARGIALVAKMWSSLLGTPVTSAQVALCLVALKASRLAHAPTHRDSWVDIAGYAAIGAEATAGVKR